MTFFMKKIWWIQKYTLLLCRQNKGMSLHRRIVEHIFSLPCRTKMHEHGFGAKHARYAMHDIQ